MDISNVRERFENVSSMLAGLRGLASAAGNGACGSGTNESAAVRDFGFGVAAYCEAISDRMELLWRALDGELVAVEVSHAKVAETSMAVRSAAQFDVTRNDKYRVGPVDVTGLFFSSAVLGWPFDTQCGGSMRFVVIADDGFGEGFLYVKGGVGSEPHFSKDESEALVFASRLQAEAVMYWLIVRNAAGVPDYDECSKGNFWVGDLDDPRD